MSPPGPLNPGNTPGGIFWDGGGGASLVPPPRARGKAWLFDLFQEQLAV